MAGIFKSKEEKAFEKEMDMQEPYSEASDESIAHDVEHTQPNYPSNVLPEGYYEYRRFVNMPESNAEYPGKIDKDVVFANFSGKKPSLEELRFQIGTIELFEGEFVEQRQVIIKDENGNILCDEESGKPIRRSMMVFDEAFRSCLNYLMAEYKFAIVASRALGVTDRASMLDISTNTRINKEFSKRKDVKDKTIGLGGF